MKNNNTRTLIFFAAVLLCFTGVIGCGPSSRFDDKIKIAGVFAGSVDDPRASVIHNALKKAEREMDVVYDVTDSVPPEELQRVLNDYAEKGYAIIFGDVPGADQSLRRIARERPKVAFCFRSRIGPSAPNLSVFNSWIYEPSYLCGLIAGGRTSSGIVGAVADTTTPMTNSLLNAFRRGVLEGNPGARVLISFTGDNPDQRTVEEKTRGLIVAGADQIFAAVPGALQVCRDKGVVAFGLIQDQYTLAPDTVITGAVWDMWPAVEKVITDVRNDRYQALDLRQWSLMDKGGAYLASYHSFEGKIPFDLKESINETRRAIMSGTFRVPVNELPPPASGSGAAFSAGSTLTLSADEAE